VLAILVLGSSLLGCGGAAEPASPTAISPPNPEVVVRSFEKQLNNANWSAVPQYTSALPLPGDVQAIKNRGRLIIALSRDDRPPFFFVNGKGDLDGIDVVIARDIARYLGVSAEFIRPGSFDDAVDAVAQKKADVSISKLSATLTRAQRVVFTDPYIMFRQAALVNRLQLTALERSNPGSPESALVLGATGRVGVRSTASSYRDYFTTTFPAATMTLYDDADALYQGAKQGEVFAVFWDEFEIDTFISRNHDMAIYLKPVYLEGKADPIAMAVAPSSNQLTEWLNLYIRRNQISSLVAKALEKHREVSGR